MSPGVQEIRYLHPGLLRSLHWYKYKVHDINKPHHNAQHLPQICANRFIPMHCLCIALRTDGKAVTLAEHPVPYGFPIDVAKITVQAINFTQVISRLRHCCCIESVPNIAIPYLLIRLPELNLFGEV